MDNAKIKNIIIIILLCMNLCLLCLVVIDRGKAQESTDTALAEAVRFVEQSGISVPEDFRLEMVTPRSYSVLRDGAFELKNMRALLGSVKCEELGGNIYFYSSDTGQASLRGSGETDVLFFDGAYATGVDPVKTAQRVLSKLGVETDADFAKETVGDDGSISITLPGMWNGGVIFNSSFTFTFSTDCLLMLSGARPFDKSTADNPAAIDTLTAVTCFLETVRNGYVCSRLDALTLGYTMSVTVSGESTLTPVWCFSTDSGNIYINAVTGRLESYV